MLVIRPSKNDFNPFGNIVILKAVGIGKRAYEVNTLVIKNFDDQNRSKRHLISTR